MDNETKIGVSFSNEVKNLDELKKYEERLKNIYGYIGALKDSKTNKFIKKIEESAESLDKNVKEEQQDIKKMGNIINTAFNAKILSTFKNSLSKVISQMFQLSQKTTEYIENVNLLEVAYKNANETIEQSSSRIENYISKMSEAYGLDESRLTRQFGIFKQLANAMQLPTETAENLSEIMVKMTNDIASLYNLPLNRASNALQSALAGQVRPIRSATGADITEKTLQNTVLDLGLDRTISELSYVEKRLVMVVSLTNQLKASQGDYARTIESASNQIRIMHEQWDRLSRAVGNVFYPILEKVLPYINAVLMVLTEIFNLFASFLGFKMPDFDYSGLTGVSDLAMDIEDGLVGAGEAVDNLANKLKGLRSFDKLNVINTPSSSNSGISGGIGGAGYVDPKIMDAFNSAFGDYNDMMSEVQMKAEKIRDSIMEWLGFTKEINPETGEISWKFDHITAGTVLGGLAVGGFIFNGVEKIFGMFKKLTGFSFSNILNAFDVTKWGIFKTGLVSVAGGIGLAELISQMDWYQDLTGNQGDLFEMWGKIIEGTKYINDRGNKNSKQTEINLDNMLGMLSEIESKPNQTKQDKEYAERLKEMISETIDQQFASTERPDVYRTIEDLYKQGYYNMPSMFNQDDAILITNYTNALKDYFDTIDERMPNLQGYYDTIDQSEIAFKNASDGLGLLITQMSSSNFDITSEQIQKINNYLEQMKTATHTSAQAFTDAVTTMSIKLQEQGYISDETAQKVVDNALKKQLAEEGATQQYIDGMIDLQHQLDAGTISETEFYKKAVDLYNEFDKTPSVIKQTTDKIDFLNKNTKITAENMGEVQTSFDDAKRYANDALTSINSDYEKNKDMLMDWLSQYDEGSQEYKDITEMIEGLNKQHSDSVAEVENSYLNYLKNTLYNLKNSKQGFTDEGKALAEALQKGIDELTPKIKISADTSQATTNINDWLARNSDLLGTGTFASKALKLTRYFSYASGGLPPVGQVFVANERGPELVDQIGGQTFVANQKQIGEYMDKRYGSYQQPLNVTIPVSVGGEQLGTIVLNNLQELAKTNGQAITIG